MINSNSPRGVPKARVMSDEERKRFAAANSGTDFSTLEMQAFWTKMPGFAAIPGTFRAYPTEDDVFWFEYFGGHTKEGRWVDLWEADYARINDRG